MLCAFFPVLIGQPYSNIRLAALNGTFTQPSEGLNTTLTYGTSHRYALDDEVSLQQCGEEGFYPFFFRII